MRIIAGEYRSRPLKAVPGQATRPTTDKIKEAIFNLLGPDLSKCRLALDFYAGSGALGIEAVSRGVNHAVLCEKHPQAQKVIAENILITKEAERFTLLRGNNRKCLAQSFKQFDQTFDLVFLDPPYHKAQLAEDMIWLASAGMLTEGCILVCESDEEHVPSEDFDQFVQIKQRKYGISVVSLYRYQARRS